MTITTSAICYIVAGETLSKVKGNKNYVVRINTHFKTVFWGKMGVMNKTGYAGATFSDIKEFGLTWAYFTYKKDALALTSSLENEGYHITLLQ